jgi:PAS domain S-box-containing protein
MEPTLTHVITGEASAVDPTSSAVALDPQWFEVLFRQNAQPVWIFDPRTLEFLDVNDAAVQRYGYPRERFLSMTLKDIRPPEDVPALLDAVMSTDRGRRVSGEWRHLSSTGELIYAEVATYAVTWRDRPARLAVVSDVTERHHAEETLKRTIQDYRGLFENAHDAILIISADDENGDERVLDVNRRACEVYGYSRSEFIGMPLRSIAQDPAKAVEHLRWTVERGSTLHVESVHRRHDGSAMAIEINAAAVTYQQHQAVMSINRDVTARRQAEERLRREEQRRRLHVEQTPLGVIEWDINFCVTTWNPGAQRIFGFSSQEAIGRCARDWLIPESARVHVERIWQELLASRGGLRSTNENLTKDGRLILCEWYNTPLVDEHAQVVGVASLVQDVTEAVVTRRALERSEAMYRAVAESVADAVSLHDMDGRITFVTAAVQRIIGFEPHELLGRDAYELMHPDDRARVRADAHEALLRGQPAWVEWRWQHRDGSYVWVETNATVLPGEHGKPAQILCATRDISRRKREQVQADANQV